MKRGRRERRHQFDLFVGERSHLGALHRNNNADRASIARGYPDRNGEIDRWVGKFLRPGRPTPTGKLLMTLT
jgi:hypothetical protein